MKIHIIMLKTAQSMQAQVQYGFWSESNVDKAVTFCQRLNDEHTAEKAAEYKRYSVKTLVESALK